MTRTILFIFLSTVLFSCNEMEEKKRYSKIEKSLVSDKYENIWKLNPIFSIEEALMEAKNRNEDILVLFAGINNSGNPSRIFNLLNSDRVAAKIGDSYVICILFLDVPYKLKDDDNNTMKEINTSLQNKLIGRSDSHNFVKMNYEGDVLSESFNCISCTEDELLEYLQP